MKMKRTVYHFDGKDYEEGSLIEITFNIQAVSIQNFLNEAKKHRLHVKSFGNLFEDYQRTSTDGLMKKFIFWGNINNFVEFAQFLGKPEWQELNNNWYIRNCNLRAYDFGRYRNYRYDGIMCYDPCTHKSELKSNAPCPIPGNQVLFNGKLWRKFYNNKSMR